MNKLPVPDELNGILLNTPNRNEILNDGPPRNCCASILGKGAYGIVFKAIFCEQPVAVKIVKNKEDHNQQILRNESNILGWQHKNIMKILQIESTPKFGIIIMERFEGQCLQSILETINLPLEHRVFICLDILSALSYCHQQNLLHLDVKPQNIFVCFNQSSSLAKYTCKLCDFGASTPITSTQYQQGTVRYMSPEALCGGKLTAAADIYSLGITMWQLKFRQLPYHWIECNDIVAYQVVKQHLRPDAKDRLQVKRLVDCHCQLTSSASATLPSALPQVEAALRQKGLSSLNAVERPKLRKRRAFKELDLNINLQTQNPTQNAKESNDYLQLTEIFNEHKHSNYMQQAELKFQKIYQQCWYYKPECRPAFAILRRNFENLLFK